MISATRTIDLGTLRRFDRPGPRYTSYPTAVEFDESVDAETYRSHLAGIDRADPGAPISLYVHIPFCQKRCSFCACHVIATPHREVAERYLSALEREMRAVAAELPRRRRVAQMHWGGGTPTYLSPAQIEELFGTVRELFTFEAGAEIAIEVDPRVTTRAQLDILTALGFNRLSVGLQDPSPAVQEAIGRGQSWEETEALIDYAREIGFREGINVDLIYGLPRQEVEAFARSLDQVIELRPDRLAIYSFAFVPWLKPNQRRLEPGDFPSPARKLELYGAALNRLLAAGYEPIGMDHFALPGNDLAIAAHEGRLRRNFMGYTVQPVSTSIGFGVSAIGDLGSGYFQNRKKLSTYYAALDAGRLPVERGRLLDGDDLLRRAVIMHLMCDFHVDKASVSERFGIDFDTYFAHSLEDLRELEDSGLVRNRDGSLEVPPEGRLFVRNAAMAFDRYLAAKVAAGPTFSRTV